MGKRRSQALKWRYIKIFAIAILMFCAACSNPTNLDLEQTQNLATVKNELNIWWEQGFNLDEDIAIRRIVDDWQSQTGNQVKLSFFPNSGLIAKAKRALKIGKPPDILMAPKAERILYPRLAWEGRLEDITDILEPVKEQYPAQILQGVSYYNAKDNLRSYYGVPIYQATTSIFYWQNLLRAIGLTPADIPQDWDGFWRFWQEAQIALKPQNPDIYGLGLSLSGDKSADDTHYLFEQILEAYDINLLDEEGNLNLSYEVRQKIIDRLSWYAKLYRQGYIPPDAVQWSNIDNNLNLLNQSVLMTPNGSLSIPATVRQDPETYYNGLAIAKFPNKPNGKPMRHQIFIRQAVIFRDSLNQSLAKEFLRYFIQPEVTIEYLKASGSRNQPVQNREWLDPYWQNTQDPYITSVAEILTTGQTRLSHIVDNPAYSQILAENVWGKALTQITVNNLSPELATDKALAKIKSIFTQWK